VTTPAAGAAVLVLGGTAEARALAAALVGRAGMRVVSSLAGRVANPRLPAGEVRIGGFGGSDRLARWLRDERIDAVVDATHPFAERISASAASACAEAGIPLLRLERPGWRERRGDRWHWAENLEHAAALTERLSSRAFLTTGRQGLAAFAEIERTWFLVRCVDPPEGPLPPRHELVLERGPYTLARERQLFESRRIDVLVTKDSGGEHTAAKLDVARERRCPVIVVRRPPCRQAAHAANVEGALDWLERRLHDAG